HATLAEQLSSTSMSSAQFAARQTEIQDKTSALRSSSADENQLSTKQLGVERAIDRALGEQSQAEQAMKQGAADEASDHANEAAQSLQEAAKAALDRAADFENQSTQLQISELTERLADLLERQQVLVDGFSNPSFAVPSDGSERELGSMAAEQEAIRQRLGTIRSSLDNMPGANWVLSRTDSDMLRTVAAAQRKRIQPQAVESAGAALSKLQLLSDTLQETQEKPASADETSKDQDSSQEGKDQPETPSLLTFKLFRELQKQINVRTLQVDKMQIEETQRAQLMRELAAEQEALAKEIARLLQQLRDSAPEGREVNP
ncbi:MAG: hypothetical protein AAF483_14775, partial [Planctomycetota bacterium]